jgi:hypothetical protein
MKQGYYGSTFFMPIGKTRRTIAFTLTPKATPFFALAYVLLKVAFAKVFVGFGCR